MTAHPSPEPAWWAHAACTGAPPDLWFPGQGDDQTAAKAVCAGCSVRDACLDHAMTHDERWGIWGGLSRKQRVTLRRARRRAEARA